MRHDEMRRIRRTSSLREMTGVTHSVSKFRETGTFVALMMVGGIGGAIGGAIRESTEYILGGILAGLVLGVAVMIWRESRSRAN